MKDLPEVAGRLECSLEMFEHRCKILLGEEQEKIVPDNALIALLCDSIRLSREYAEYIKSVQGIIREFMEAQNGKD